MNVNLSQKIVCVFLLLFSLQLTSLAPIFKYCNVNMIWFLPCYTVIMTTFYCVLFFKSLQPLFLQKFLDSPLTMIFLFILLLFVNAILYHYQLTLQSIGRGTDAGDALTFTGSNLLHGKFPYSRLTYLGNVVSAGPGLFIFALPFTYIHAYGLLIPILIMLSTYVIKTVSKNTAIGNVYLLSLLSSPAILQEIGQGNDYLIIGLVYALLTIACFYYWRENKFYQLCLACAIGLLATARLNFFYLPLLLGVFVWKQNKKAGMLIGLTGLFIAICTHLGFYLWDPPHYDPLHVINDYASYTIHSTYGLSILISLCLIAGIITIAMVKNTLTSWLFFLWLCLTTPLFVGGLFYLIHENWNIQGIGIGYIALTTPIILTAIVIYFQTKIYG